MNQVLSQKSFDNAVLNINPCRLNFMTVLACGMKKLEINVIIMLMKLFFRVVDSRIGCFIYRFLQTYLWMWPVVLAPELLQQLDGQG